MYCTYKDEREREDKADLFRDYMGQAIWHITTIQHLKTEAPNEMPQYIELAHPERKADLKEVSADEVKGNILEKLRC